MPVIELSDIGFDKSVAETPFNNEETVFTEQKAVTFSEIPSLKEFTPNNSKSPMSNTKDTKDTKTTKPTQPSTTNPCSILKPTNIKQYIILFIIFLIVRSDLFVDNVLSLSSAAVKGRVVSSYGVIIQGLALVCIYILAYYMLVNNYI